jgi:hypothetical protein
MQEKQEQEEELKAKEAELMRGNPLINVNNSTSFSVKRRSVLALFSNLQVCWKTEGMHVTSPS